jgi:hypothetical protein
MSPHEEIDLGGVRIDVHVDESRDRTIAGADFDSSCPWQGYLQTPKTLKTSR